MGQKIRFTQAQIDAIELPAEGRAIFYDATRPGLGLRVFPSGRMVWFWIGKHKGRTVRETLGSYRAGPGAEIDVTPAKAWTLAKQAGGKVAAGVRPTEEKRAEREEAAKVITLGAAYKDYCAHHVVRSTKTRNSEWKCYLKRWERRDLATVSKADVRKWFRDLTKQTSPSTANRALARLKALYSWAQSEMDYEGPNPTSGINKHSEKAARRKRRLRVDELAGFFKALDSITPDMADFFRVTLFTGQRAGNVRAMRWADLDLSGGVWSIQETKQGEAADVALAPPVVELLTARRNGLADRLRKRKARWAKNPKGPEPKASPYVFPAKRGEGHMQTYQKAWLELCAAAKISGLRVHDLRRSLASAAQDAGVGVALVAAQLGHSDAATTLRHYTTVGGKAQQDAITAVVAALIQGSES